MGYVAVKGGTEAIHNASELAEFYRVKDNTMPIDIKQVRSQMRLAIDKVMGEGGIYAPEYAAIALKQAEGDVFEAAFILRAFRTTLQRNYYSDIINTREMFVRRKISSSFREIPGGQILGPTRDYTQRTLDTAKATENAADISSFLEEIGAKIDAGKLQSVNSFGKVIDLLKNEGLLKPADPNDDRTLTDITREAVKFPAPRSARLQMMARAETGGLMALGYSSQRGFGSVHPTVGELRYGTIPVTVKDPSGRRRYIGKIEVTECEMITGSKPGKKNTPPYFTIGYGLCFGHNETKVICMSTLDSAMRRPELGAPANDQEFVLYHTEGVEAMGFTNHLKLPHYVTFQSALSNTRASILRNKQANLEAEAYKQIQSV
ncbi:MAG TPA: carbon-phosphorus lyase complex subunit PhnI [Mucilaginibacter sp.]|jgi:alpha-D-ribose 1-methylphosphonate 5-triphosphate synthase subunit PhnI|nr:carbon-phosphorus lyase complex subunit PhnI [Mucilaginibacter sp.]